MKISVSIKILFLLSFLLIQSVKVFSDDLQISLEPYFRMRFGRVNEYVFSSKSNNQNLLSQLDWDFIPIWSLGFSSSLRYKMFAMSLYFDTAIPSQTGVMTDYDFLGKNYSLTNFSKHDILLKTFIDTGGQVGVQFNILPTFFLTPFVGFSFQNLHVVAKDGYYQYLSSDEIKNNVAWHSDIPKIYVSGDIITYQQQMFAPWIGLQTGFTTSLLSSVPISIVASFEVSPYLWVFGLDTHHLRSIDFFDDMRGPYALRCNLASYFNITKKDSFLLSLGYSFVPERKGTTIISMFVNGSSISGVASDSGGTASNMMNVTIGYRRFFF